MIKGIDHIGIAVSDHKESITKWEKLTGEKAGNSERVDEQGVLLSKLKLKQGSVIELLAPTGDETPVGRFLKKRGPGIHHICFQVSELDVLVESLKENGIRFVQEVPMKGSEGSRVIFIHPGDFNGVLIELRETG
ncbi:MAG: methylmalonyl-CoA epimerase [Candidatus Aminicenantes bacterium]|nr:methylmalonyl-CoA epimerase [Candidatus Aminicenantes bacterium]